MEIGKPRKVHTVEPVRDPVPREIRRPAKAPRKPEQVPTR
jgi:hypothetical protein